MCILIYDTIGFVQIRGKCHFGVVQPVGICHYSDIMKWLMEMIYHLVVGVLLPGQC